ncbi:MAG: dicarboxylate/amino acid:cation symporter [Dysgonamonadaceae bacterium]|jgi:Na+/H+-dicarboxylate symporter|nr:dicarboxylate/amino acid:cation symporter [Dysgonamonadaceae bacterium]
MKKYKLGLLPKVIIAIVSGITLGYFLPEGVVRIFITFNGIFSNFLSFCIPLIILGLVAPGISDLGKKAGKLLLITVVLAYGSSLFSGFYTYFSCKSLFGYLDLGNAPVTIDHPESISSIPFFKIDMPPVFDVMTALILAFVLGIGAAAVGADTLKKFFQEFKQIVELLISRIIIPLLPLYIFGIFLSMSYSGSTLQIISIFGKVIGIIFVLHIFLLIIQFCIAGVVGRQNPFKLLYRMLPAYMTALGTSSSAATIPVTLEQVKRNGVSEDVADFCVPLCATIHLSGSTMKIVAMSLAVCMIQGLPYDLQLYSGFIMLLGIMMIAAPGVPGGAIMASVALLQSFLGFDGQSVGLMIALYIAIDSFGTACNVTGDGAIAIIVDKIAQKH